MLSSHAYYAFKVNLLFTNYAENFKKNISFSMRTHALNGGLCVIMLFSRRKGFEASLLFSLV